MTVVEATVIGLNATPGNGSSTAPQVTFAYKRAETALIPTSGTGATGQTDALSSLSALYCKSRFFGTTEIDDFVSTGFASRELVRSSTFGRAVSAAVAATNSPASVSTMSAKPAP
jgi:hypothetical protein